MKKLKFHTMAINHQFFLLFVINIAGVMIEYQKKESVKI